MKKPVILLLAVIAVTAGISFLNTLQQNNVQPGYEITGGDTEEEEEQSGAGKQLMSWFQSKGFPNPAGMTGKYQAAWQQYLEIKKRTSDVQTRVTAASWASVGHCIDENGNRIGGRVVCMAIDPNNTNNLWVGSASGGICKSINAGSSWTSVPTNLPVLGVSAILVDPSNSNTIYAGTGEVYHTEVPVMGFNVWKTRGTYGIGIIKSTDGGVTWSQVLTKVSSDLFAISSMAFQPGNSSTIYACATDGVYRSTNSGGTWSQVYTGINVRDIAINPSNTDQIVISVGNMTNSVKGIFRSTNGNSLSPTWMQITTGLPASYAGSIKLDNSGSGMLAASIGIGSGNEVYRSTNFGSSWTVLSSSSHTSYQFWFAHTIGVNPFFTDSLLYGGVSLYRHRTIATVGRASIGGIHADHHDIKFDPTRRGTVYVCNDGGVYKSIDGGQNFTAMNNGLNATQFYASLGVSRQDAGVMIGGLQDNGQVLFNGTNWIKTEDYGWGGGDGTACAIHPTDDNIMLAGRDAKQFFRTADGGANGSAATSYWGFIGDSRTGFVPPVAFAPSNGLIAYTATDNIHISINAGASFTNNALGTTPPYPATTPTAYIEQRHKTAIALAVSYTNENKIYVSTSPFAQYDNDVNNIYVNGNPNVFKTTTPSTTPYTSIKGTLPDRFVMDFAISPTNDDSVFVALGGFGTSHIYVTGNGGTTWTARGAGLPDVPFNAIVFDPLNPKIIYAGCDFGVYVSADRGQTWVDFNTGFWDATLVMDLQISADNKLIAATHGKGVFRSDLYSGGTLPSRLIDFSGINRGSYNQLQWVVSDEYNVAQYELERSVDGISYQKVGTKLSLNSTAQITYSINDPVNTGATEFYYRLKTVDNDGSYTYSSVIFIRTNFKPKISVATNPFKVQIVMQYSIASDQTISAALFNSAGALMRRQSYHATAGSGAYTMPDLENLPPGIYFLKAESAGLSQSFKLLKQ